MGIPIILMLSTIEYIWVSWNPGAEGSARNCSEQGGKPLRELCRPKSSTRHVRPISKTDPHNLYYKDQKTFSQLRDQNQTSLGAEIASYIPAAAPPYLHCRSDRIRTTRVATVWGRWRWKHMLLCDARRYPGRTRLLFRLAPLRCWWVLSGIVLSSRRATTTGGAQKVSGAGPNGERTNRNKNERHAGRTRTHDDEICTKKNEERSTCYLTADEVELPTNNSQTNTGPKTSLQLMSTML